MTTVLPAWKLELIEKKKKKEQDHRQKVEQEKSRKVSIPEWKRSLLEKKKEAASDSPETKEHGVSVNSVFGPRIIRKTSQLNLPIANSSQKPAVRGDYEENKTNILQDLNTVRGGSLSLSPADANSCVTKAVEIPTEVEHKSNKPSTRKEIEDNRESSRQSDVAALREDLNVASGIHQSETKPHEQSKTSSVLSYRRMFEQSKSESKETSEPCTQSKTQVQIDKRTTESTLRVESSESNPSSSLVQISNKSSVDKAHSIHSEKSTHSHPDSNQQKVFTTKPTFAPKPYKSVITTPPWLKNTSPKNITFQIGHKSVQEDVVAEHGNSEVQSAPKDFDTSEKKGYVIESGAKENVTKTFESEDKQKFSFSKSNDPVVPSSDVLQNKESVRNTTQETVLPLEKTVQKYSVIKETDSKEEHLASRSGKGSESLKYIVIDNRDQQEPTPTIEKDKTSVSATSDSVSQVPNESGQHDPGDNVPHPSSIESLRNKFGSSGSYRRWTSEENIFLKGSQAEQSDQVVFIRRSSELRRPSPPTKRWSADILSLTSQPIDNGETSNLSPTSETKSIPTANQVKRPPPPAKRWTADVINVMPRQIDENMSNLSPRSDSSKNSVISPSNSLSRGRSSSLCDIREEIGLDYFQHKSNVAQGIEHRVNKLIRKMSISETQMNVDDVESDSTSDEDPLSDLDLKLAANKEKDVPAEPQDVQPVFARKHSVSSEIEHRVTELFHRQLSQQSDAEESEGEKSSESNANITDVQVVDDVKEPLPENLKLEPLPVVSTKAAIDFDSAPVKDDHDEEPGDVLPESKPVSGSVHKLSALFGSSILKPKKKDKSVTEEKTKEKASKSSKLHSSDRSNQKGSSGDDGKKSTLFSKAQKSEEKSTQKDKQQSNTNIFPWLRKGDKKESTGGNKTKELLDKNQKNSSSSSPNEGTDSLLVAAFGLQPVRKPAKVEQRLFGNVKIISNASHEHTPPKGVYHKPKPSVQISEPEKEKIAPKKVNESKTGNKGADSQIPAIVTQYWNGNKESCSSETSTNESVPITSIDEVPVSAIDMPEAGDNDVTVSVIDVPASPDNHSVGKFAFFNGHKEDLPNPGDDDDDVSVSVIDLPSPGNEKISAFQDGYLEADELSDGSDEDEVEGSYNFATGEITHVVNGDITQDDEDEDEDEDDEDEDVPISYIGSAPKYPVPQVVFDSEPVQLKSCLSPRIERKKMNKGKVSFKSSHTVHDYPSEETVTAAYDEYQKNSDVQPKTLQNYQPAGLVNMERSLSRVRGHEERSMTPSAPITNGDINSYVTPTSKSLPEIKYADEGQGFTDATDYASALLF